MKRTLKIAAKVLAGIIISVVLLLVLAIALLRLPVVQTFVTHKVVAFVSGKTHTKIELDKIYIGFPKSVVLEGLYAEDLNHDTLLAVTKLSVDIDMLKLLHNTVEINKVNLNGVNANIFRSEADSTFNFNFFITAFTGAPKQDKSDTDNTKGKPWKIQVNNVLLENIRATFNDSIAGTEIAGRIGKLDLNMKAMDIQKLSFEGKELTLEDANVRIAQNKPGTNSPDTAIVVMPLLAMNKLNLHRVDFVYESLPNGQRIKVHAGNAILRPDEIDLNAHKIKAKSVQIDSTSVFIALRKDEDTSKVETKSNDVHPPPAAPWIVSAGKLKLDAIDFKLDFTNVPRQAKGMDYNHLYVQDIHVDIEDAYYSPTHTEGRIHNVTAREQSGIVLKQLVADVIYDEHYAQLKNLKVVTNSSTISREAKITYTRIEDIGKDVGELGIQADLRNTRVAIKDILVFAPMLKDAIVFKGNEDKMIAVSGKVHGKLKDIFAENLEVSALDSTTIKLDGHIIGLPDVLNAKYDVDIKSIVTNKKDLNQLLGDSVLKAINVPNNIALSGKVDGSMRDAAAKLNLQTSSGNAVIDATFKMQPGDTAYTAIVSTEALDLGYLLRNEKLLGPITIKADVKGHNFSINNLAADVKAEIESAMINKYNYKNISIDATTEKNLYKAKIVSDDPNLKLKLDGIASFKTDSQYIVGLLDLQGANLQALNLHDENVRVAGKLNAMIDGDLKALKGDASISDVMVIKGDDTYRVDSLAVVSVNDKKRSKLKMDNGVIMVDYDGTVQVPQLISSLTHHINQYFLINPAVDTITVDTATQDFTLAIKISPHPILDGVLLPGLKKFNGLELQSKFDSKENILELDLDLPVIEYNTIGAEQVSFKLNTTEEALEYKLQANTLTAGPVKLAETTFQGKAKDNVLDFALNIFDEDSADKLIVAGDLREDEPKEFKLHLSEDKLTISNTKWTLPSDNYIAFGAKGLMVNDIVLNNGGQSLSVQSSEDGNEMKIDVKQFELGTLSQIVERDTPLIRGVLNGTAELRNLKKAMAFVADMTIDKTHYMAHPVGDIKIKADNLTANRYTAQVSISGYGNDVQANGYYSNASSTNNLDFKVDINKLNLVTVEPFTGYQIRRSKGYLAGEVTITGTSAKPAINGFVDFKDASFNVAYLNNYITLKDERLAIDPKGVYFKSFTILDSLGRKANLAGAVYTNDMFKTMKFDAKLTTNNFTALNTTIRDNPLFFGKVIISSDISIQGDNTLPIVRADLDLLKGSDIAVIVPSSKVSVDRGEGVVVLVDTASTYDIMNSTDTAELLTAFRGIDLSARITINDGTTLKVVVDKQSGDSLVVRGEGKLSFTMDESGNQNLIGTYYLNSGGYRATIQKIIKRELKIQPGGSITWNGSPLDAEVDITAVYSVNTSPVDLLASDLGATSVQELNAYRKPLRFDVLMSMQGKLLKPKIDFKLGMAEEDQNAYGGMVYAKVTSLNNDPSELNKQVFALLIMKKFIPSGIAGEGAGAAASNFARNSVSQILTDQLNRLSGSLIKGVDLSFGIRNNDEYTAQGTTQNTQFSVGVSKSFFRDRLNVKLGTSVSVDNNTGSVSGTDANSLTGDIVLEYKINKEGTLRFKAFRENQYEGIIDGNLYKTGVGFSATKDYDTPKELFTPSKTKEQRKEEARLDKEEAQKEKAERIAARLARKAEREAKKAAKKSAETTPVKEEPTNAQ
ncbi:MAG: translocation/assembly module TamB domain-containing protein [Bacteroidetes bacterium]|nr:translocation/assembly module TamB domain-containing protein [Bacteroidota bacterium]